MTAGRFWLVQSIVWPLYGLVHYAATLPAITPEERWHMAGIKAVRALAGLMISSPLPLLYRRVLASRIRPLTVVAITTAVPYALSHLWLVLDRVLLSLVRSLTPLRVNWARFPRGVDLDYVFVLLAWTGGYVAFWYWQDAARHREESLQQAMAVREAQLRALTAQLSPHFLFNALNSLRNAIAEDPERAREMVTRLAGFLRYSLHAQPETPLGDEIDAARAYLAIEQARFERGVDVSIDVDPATVSCLVPSLLLQPLIENALKHGSPDATGVRRIRVETRLEQARLWLEVANTGGLAATTSPDSGVGMKNTRDRLIHTYGGRQRFRLVPDQGWVRAIVEIEEPRHASPSPDR